MLELLLWRIYQSNVQVEQVNESELKMKKYLKFCLELVTIVADRTSDSSKVFLFESLAKLDASSIIISNILLTNSSIVTPLYSQE